MINLSLKNKPRPCSLHLHYESVLKLKPVFLSWAPVMSGVRLLCHAGQQKEAEEKRSSPGPGSDFWETRTEQ